jgi:gliding motility-associated lipoprotein GldD
MKKFLFPILTLFLLVTACEDTDNTLGTPKPRGYFRIALPEKKYSLYSEDCPFSFELPGYAHMYHSAAPNAEPCWRDLYFGPFKATLYLSYVDIVNDTMIGTLINQNWELFEAHRQMAGGMRDSSILRANDHVYGSVVTISGNAATPLQFYLTDSTKHFLRGSLYFYATPNKDSIAPVLDFIKKDVYHIAETLQWKDGIAPVKSGLPSPAEKK